MQKFVMLLSMISLVLLSYSCAPVKFARSNNITVDPNVNPSANSISCSPKINDTLDSFTYSTGASLPFIVSGCNQSDLSFQWIVKKADATVISTSIPGLSPVESPRDVDFKVLGSGVYYVFLEATGTQSSVSFLASTPLEFIVPGPNVGNSLVCDPKLNQTFTSVVINESNVNPQVTANCVPQAAMYLWTVLKNGVTNPVIVPGLSSETQTPDFKSLGEGTYNVSLYATAPNSGAWRSSAPLMVTVQGAPPTAPKIECTPRINGSLTELTLTGMSPKPLISANCSPADVQYSWSVTRGGMNVSSTGLAGANSNPDFVSYGVGTYIINLVATKSGMTTWTSTKPLAITVDPSGTGLAIQCAPRLNGKSVAMTITTAGPNPAVTSGCIPSGVTHQWLVTKGGKKIDGTGISGASSTPQLAQLGAGTYLIFLTATLNGYNSFVSPSPLEVTVGPTAPPTRKVTYSKRIEVTNNKVDVLMVIDDSNSMLPDNLRLAQRMNDFVTDLSNLGIDWQICATVTRMKDVTGNGDLMWGVSRVWTGLTGDQNWILKPTAPDTNSKFVQTITDIGSSWENSDDERGIKAAHAHVSYSRYPFNGGTKDYNFCNRDDASLSVIAISDEDEYSIGGDDSIAAYPKERGKPLQPEDLPQNYINQVKQLLGADKQFTWNSIIVKPGDTTCRDSQNSEGAVSHYGYKYDELSKATGGFVGSICDADYKSNLNFFKDRIVSSLASVPLECAPVGKIDVTIVPSMGDVRAELRSNSNTLVFTPAILAGRQLTLEYYCPQLN
jgi:hypothetical protein